MKKIGFIGVGVMGKAMIQNLANANYEMHIYSRTKEKAESIISNHIIWHDTVKECVENVDVVMTMVGFPKDVEEVYFSENGILNHAKSGTLLIDFTTSSPSLAIAIYQAAKEKGMPSLDCPVSGGDVGAKMGTLSIMVGGDQEAFTNWQTLFEPIGKTITYTGKAGNGQHTKMTNQIALAGAISGVCEALTYANNVGLDPQNMLDCISQGAAGSWQMSNMAPRILKEDLDPGFYIKHYIKDMLITKDVMDEKDTSLTILNTVLAMYQELQDQGYEDLGTQALIKYYENKEER